MTILSASNVPIEWTSQFADCGYAILPRVFDAQQIHSLSAAITTALQSHEPSVLRSQGRTYGSRDLATLVPEVREISKHSVLQKFIVMVLGERAGLVRALYFDKPPGRSWSLPWHKDRTIAVRDNTLQSQHFSKPTMKAGIPHVEASESLLAEMLTLRIHLDPMTVDNGPLSVIPGSHISPGALEAEPVELHAASGDVLAMRPLLSHSSSLPRAGTTLHRRIIHLEFAPDENLPDGFHWHSFQPVT